jgi:hypothetical protein
MTLIPAFEIGVWNAWIFMLVLFLPGPILMRVHKGVVQESLKLYGEAHTFTSLLGYDKRDELSLSASTQQPIIATYY